MAARNSTGTTRAVAASDVPTTEDRLIKLNRQLDQIRAIAWSAEMASLDEDSLNSIVEAIDDIADDMAVDLAAVMGALAKASPAEAANG